MSLEACGLMRSQQLAVSVNYSRKVSNAKEGHPFRRLARKPASKSNKPLIKKKKMKTLKTTLKSFPVLTLIALTILSCKEEEIVIHEPQEDIQQVSASAVVAAGQATNVNFSSATLGGSITSDGGAHIQSKGFCFGLNPSPTLENDTTNQGSNAESFVAHLTELQPNTTYYVRAYAINKTGLSYGEEFSFVTTTGLPKVSLDISDITFKKASITLTVTEIGGSAITNTGFVYSTENPEPTIMDIMWPSVNTDLVVQRQLTDLSVATKYYVRAYAQNNQGRVYSDVVELTTRSIPTLTDLDGNVYQTILVGDQAWMTENLRVTKYNNGDAIATTLNDVSGEASPKYQWTYNNDDANAPVYGRYYTYYTVTDARKVCPAGSHVPSMDEMAAMFATIGNDGGKYKQVGTTTWKTPNTSATNSSGFNAPGSGYRNLYGGFGNFQEYVFLMTSNGNETDDTRFKGYYLSYNIQPVNSANHWVKKSGYSVRCVAD